MPLISLLMPVPQFGTYIKMYKLHLACKQMYAIAKEPELGAVRNA